MSTAGIHLHNPSIVEAATWLHEHSALRYCTELVDDGEHLVTTLPLSCLSSGEQVLWEALGCLMTAYEVDPGAVDSARKLTDSPALDADNRAALSEAIALWELYRYQVQP